MAAGRRADERWRSIDLRATAVPGLAVITVVIVAFLWKIGAELPIRLSDDQSPAIR